ncbi:MAG: peptidyl-prolyl cis-trans isomerase [Candidatus Hydrogenedentes bacterium]|nr:peptidyl-prolyl cis-trans isomerase [Candidatus Hydrogenedentota bacterium]
MSRLGAWCGAILAVAVAGVAVAQAPDLEQLDLVLKAIPNGPVARINGAMVDGAEFRDLYIGELSRFAQMNPGTPVSDKVRIGVAFSSLRLLLQREILKQEAAARKLAITDEELAKGWENELAQLRKALAQGKEEEPTEAEVLELAGATREEAMEELREGLLIEKVRRLIVEERGVAVSDEEVADWYEANRERMRRPDMCHLKQVLIRMPKGRTATPDAVKQARQRAEDALQRIRSGESFDKVAREVTEHPQQIRDKGGDIGTGPVSALPEPLQKAVYSMEPGAVSDVIETTAGYFISLLVEFVPGEELTLEKGTPQIRTLLMAKKENQAVREFCGEATASESAIQIYLDLEKQLVARPDLIEELSEGMAGEGAAGLEIESEPMPREGREAP